MHAHTKRLAAAADRATNLMINLHEYYDQLTPLEKSFVDDFMREMFDDAQCGGMTLAGDDRAERVADAVARWIIESRQE